MKLPRWLVIAMLTTSVVSVLAAAGWWWVTWPERTAREFVDLLSKGRFREAEDMLTRPSSSFSAVLSLYPTSEPDLKSADLAARTISEIIAGRQRFTVGNLPWEFIAERTQIRFEWRQPATVTGVLTPLQSTGSSKE